MSRTSLGKPENRLTDARRVARVTWDIRVRTRSDCPKVGGASADLLGITNEVRRKPCMLAVVRMRVPEKTT